MATDLQPMYDALQKAHAAGDAKSAQKLADYIRAQQAATAAKGDAIEAVPLHPVEAVADAASGMDPSSWFSTKDPKQVSAAEAAGAVGGGAVAGALGGAALPGVLRATGKVVPGVLGKGIGVLGEALGAMPLKERTLRGAGGGAVMGGVGKAGEALGLPPALTEGASLVGGGLGESAASFLTKETGQLLKFAANAAYANTPGMTRALQGMLSPNRELNEAAAVKLQKKLFGDRTDGYLDKLTGTDNQRALQEALRKADPSLLPGPKAQGAVRAPWEGEATGEMMPMSSSTDLATAGRAAPRSVVTAIAGGEGAANPLVVAPTGAAAGFTNEAAAAAKAGGGVPGMEAGRAGARAKLTAAQAEAQRVEDAQAAAAMKPASEIYRDRMMQGVTAAVKDGKSFSTTPEFAAFEKELQRQVTLGYVGKADAGELLRTLRLDRSKVKGDSGGVLDGYAKRVDDHIREWGKPAEGGVARGAAAIDAGTARDVRGALRDAYNQYTERLGLGAVEKQYRSAYSQEMIAEAKDKLPHMLQAGFSKPQAFDAMVRNLSRDPEGKVYLQGALAKHLANTEPKAIVGEFERLQRSMVSSELLQPAELRALREGAAAVKRTADKGLQQRAAVQLKQMMLMAMTRQGGAAAGAAAGGGAAAGEEQQQ